MFNYKDCTHLRVAILSYLEKLSSIDEGDQGVGEDRFAEIQDDIQYFRRLRDLVDREIAAMQLPPKAPVAKLSVVPSDGQSE